MVSKNGGLVTIAIGILSIIFSVSYISSCTKPIEDDPWSCNYVHCNNGGVCDSARCVCPVGYEGSDCSVKTIAKFYGNWKATFTNVGSDSINRKGKDTVYTLQIMESATPTTFFFNNFNNNINYSHILCKLDSANHSVFGIDPTQAQNMFYDQYRIRNGWGVMYKPDSISGMVFIRSLNYNLNWQNDTFVYRLQKM